MHPISENIQFALIVAAAFCSIGCIAWFFSTRPKAFIRIFVPSDEQRDAVRLWVRDEQWGPAMRQMANLQIGLGIILGFVVWLFN